VLWPQLPWPAKAQPTNTSLASSLSSLTSSSTHYSEALPNSEEDCQCTIPFRNPDIPVAADDSKENA
jgi:hypothetical protein